MTREQLREFMGEYICGCGEPDLALAALLRLLELHPLYDNRSAFKSWVTDDGIQYLLLYMLDHMGLAEHGGSVGGQWLTDKGKDVRNALKAEQADDFAALTACGWQGIR